MHRIFISDNTVRSAAGRYRTSFRLKLETSRLLDRLGVSCIETSPIGDNQADYLAVKSIASTVKKAAIAVPVDILNPASINTSWEAVSGAVNPRLQVPVPCSTVQMEYFCHRKPEAVASLVSDTVKACADLCADVEFIALDFTRAEKAFLGRAISAAVEAGASIITLSDAAGNLLPDEFGALIAAVKETLPANVRLGVQCSDGLFLADACAVEAVRAGADEIKTSVFGDGSSSLPRFAHILKTREEMLGISCEVKITELDHIASDIKEMFELYSENPTATATVIATAAADSESPALSGDFSEEETVLETIPETFSLDTYLINSGNVISSTCHLCLKKDGHPLECVCVGNGPVDAAFHALEQLIGSRYELEEFKIRSVTEGREAMGETLINLRHEGRLFSGRGLSTDIVGSSILAYLDAANKIAYGEGLN